MLFPFHQPRAPSRNTGQRLCFSGDTTTWAVAAIPTATPASTAVRRERRNSLVTTHERRLVRKEGLEPSRCYPQVPETCASTSSATCARVARIAPRCRGVNRRYDSNVAVARELLPLRALEVTMDVTK